MAKFSSKQHSLVKTRYRFMATYFGMLIAHSGVFLGNACYAATTFEPKSHHRP
jgi:hypothetical protein